MTPTLESEIERLQKLPSGTLKRAKAADGHSPDAPYCCPSGGDGGRIMVLERVEITAILEDPFFEHGRYGNRLTLAEFPEWQLQPSAEYVRSEHERLGIKLPANHAERTTGLLLRYESMLVAAQKAISAELARIAVEIGRQEGRLLL